MAAKLARKPVVKLSAFTPDEAAHSSSLAGTFADAVEAHLALKGEDRMNPASRRAAVVETLHKWSQLAPSPHGAADAPSLGHQLSADDVRRVLTGTMPNCSGDDVVPAARQKNTNGDTATMAERVKNIAAKKAADIMSRLTEAK